MTKNLKFIFCGILGTCLAMPAPVAATPVNNAPLTASKAKQRTIVKVDAIHVETPVGTAPRLPWQIWVTYSDGTHEWRQTKWSNSLLSTEQQEANPELYPAGKTYTVNGFIIGDNTTDNGFPITANVTVTDKQWSVPSQKPIAQPLPLGDVYIEEGNRLRHNQ